MGHFGNPTREFGVALLRQALVFGNPTRERGTESGSIVPRSRVELPKIATPKLAQRFA